MNDTLRSIINRTIATIGLVTFIMLITCLFLYYFGDKTGWMQLLGYPYEYDYGFTSALGGMNFTIFLGIGFVSALLAQQAITYYDEKNK